MKRPSKCLKPALHRLPLRHCTSPASTNLAWNNVPATRVAMAISSLCPAKT